MMYYDPQNQSPVCYCARCRAEIYPGKTCYPIDGWQVLCQECHEEAGQAGDIVKELIESFGGSFATEEQLRAAASFMLGTL